MGTIKRQKKKKKKEKKEKKKEKKKTTTKPLLSNGHSIAHCNKGTAICFFSGRKSRKILFDFIYNVYQLKLVYLVYHTRGVF